MPSSHTDINGNDKAQAQLHFQKGCALLTSGNLEEADCFFISAHNLDGTNVDALNLLGIRAYQKQRWQDAIDWLNKATQVGGKSAHTLSNLGLVFTATGEFQKAIECFNSSISLDPTTPETHNNLGNVLKKILQVDDALISYAKAIELRPNYAEAINNQGVVFLEGSKIELAIDSFLRAIQINENFSEALNNLGNAYASSGKFDLAFQSFERALQINPLYLDASLNFGNSLKKAKEYAAAIQCYEYASQIKPNDSKAYYRLGEVYYEIGHSTPSKENYRKASSLDPDNLELKVALLLAQIPKAYQSYEELLNSRNQFAIQLQQLKNLNSYSTLTFKTISKIISRHPFYLAYQAENNKYLMMQFGALLLTVAKQIQDRLNIPEKNEGHSGGKIRIGIISHHICNHPVWHAITRGWMKNIDTNLFEIYLFNTGGLEDDETAFAKSKAASYLNQNVDLLAMGQAITQKNLDVLLYPEIGMDPTTKELACLRLAPIQIVSWGHPETTGLPTIDYFFSGLAFEPDACQENYSEKVIPLPSLGTYFEKDEVTPTLTNLVDLGIDPASPILLCAGSPSKYSPDNDYVLVEIAKKLGRCQFIFFHFQDDLSAILKHRLSQAFLESGLDANTFIRFIPFLQKTEFHGLMYQASVYLDTIGFSGFNTAMQAISCNLPIVASEGNFMRGRLASTILRKLKLDQLVATSNEEYIAKVAWLIQNQGILKTYKDKIAESKFILFEDIEPIKALENFLIDAITTSPKLNH